MAMPQRKSDLPPRKRLSTTSPGEAATHYEVFQLVKRRKIHLAEELFSLARERSTKGDHSLLLYCSGEKGALQILQNIIDSAWRPDPGIAEASSSSAPSLSRTHTAPLTTERLQELKALARAPPRPPEAVPFKIIKKPGQRKKYLVAPLDDRRPSRADEVNLFDSFGVRAEIVFRPRCGVWRLRDFYEVLATARQAEVLAGATPSASSEGGFRLRRSEAGWRAMLRAGVASPRRHFSELSEAQLQAARPELRFGLGCGAIAWRPPSGAEEADVEDAWIDAMPEDPAFNKDTLEAFAHEERLVRLWAHRYVEDRQLLAVVHAFEACRHGIQQTQGFMLDRGNMCITATRLSMSRHKAQAKLPFGAISAQACAQEAASGSRSSLLALMGGSHRSGLQRPPRLSSHVKAITDAASTAPSAALLDAGPPTPHSATGPEELAAASSPAPSVALADSQQGHNNALGLEAQQPKGALGLEAQSP